MRKNRPPGSHPHGPHVLHGELFFWRTVMKRIYIAVLAIMAVALSAQEREDRTLLPQEQMTAIINEASGERAMHHVLELVGYQRVRPPVEYEGTFRESEVMARFAREYGYSNVTIEKYGETNA